MRELTVEEKMMLADGQPTSGLEFVAEQNLYMKDSMMTVAVIVRETATGDLLAFIYHQGRDDTFYDWDHMNLFPVKAVPSVKYLPVNGEWYEQ